MLNVPKEGAKLELRPELQFSLQQSQGSAYYLIEDPVSGTFFRMGIAEWTFASKFNGQRNSQEAYEATVAEVGNEHLPADSAQQTLAWLTSSGLLRQADQASVAAQRPVGQLLSNIFFSRVPLFHPDAQLSQWLPFVKWCFTWPALVAWICLLAVGGLRIVGDWDRFFTAASSYMSPSTWLYLFVIWLAMKIVHEAFHGFACKHFGGHVGACGIVFILFSPIAFVDVTSSWKLRSKWKRIAVSAAGMYVELAIAAIAAIAWSRTSSPSISHFCHAIVTTAGIGSILFNANPLMRFDAYYMLADFLDIQNLYNEGRQHAVALARSWTMGLETALRPRSALQHRIILAYGLASSVWRVVISVSLTIGAATLFHGIGVLLALAAGIVWFALPVYRTTKFALVGNAKEKPDKSRVLRTAVVGFGLLASIFLVPLPGGVRAPGIVKYQHRHDMRARSSGFVQQVHVSAGQRVKAGQVLVTMQNDTLLTEEKKVKIEAFQSKINARILRNDDEVAAAQAEREHFQALVEKLHSLQEQTGHLVIRAPANGVVISPHTDELLGQYLEAGENVLSIAQEDSKEIHVSIPEYHLESFTAHVGQSPMVLVKGNWKALKTTTLERVEPGASDQIQDAALSANHGGPLAVVPVAESDESGRTENRFRLAAPRFCGHLSIPPEDAKRLRAGQLANIRVTSGHETLGSKLVRLASRWVVGKWEMRR